MPAPALSARFVSRVFLMCFAVAFATLSRAENSQGGFSSTLSNEQKTAVGLATLTPDEREALDQLVKIEVAQARSEGNTELENTFTTRHTSGELHRAGLDRLTP